MNQNTLVRNQTGFVVAFTQNYLVAIPNGGHLSSIARLSSFHQANELPDQAKWEAKNIKSAPL